MPGDVNPLLVHSVTDATALAYLRAARLWLEWLERHSVPVLSLEDKDAAMGAYLATLAYGERANLGRGRLALFGAEYVWTLTLPVSRRAIKSWEKFAVQGEGGPVPWAVVGAIASWLEDQPEAEAHLAAQIVLASADMYLRESDWENIRTQDVADGDAGMAITLGVAERGEATKTGVRQGVRPDRPGVEALLRARLASLPPGSRVFPLSKERFRSWWRRACSALDVDVGPPHSLRHTGPSFDLFSNYRSLDQLRTRGRWRAKTSVLRYAKTHVYVDSECRVPLHVRALGQPRIEALGVRPRRARD